ncbi:hypothetical protein RIF29_28494 [Crotalaria pallida]|uniref:Protein kinase domain-containing protein n=1 Tax=Crotalaria pallida TaxID=3830 RepID=A0AAN9EF50_CROPI
MPEVEFSSKRNMLGSDERNMDDLDLSLFDFNIITMATYNFSKESKLGQGGFGVVYKESEFKNEVKLLVKLQHPNLVCLLGCTIQMDEKMLDFLNYCCTFDD